MVNKDKFMYFKWSEITSTVTAKVVIRYSDRKPPRNLAKSVTGQIHGFPFILYCVDCIPHKKVK